jgi:hypothetical protein
MRTLSISSAWYGINPQPINFSTKKKVLPLKKEVPGKL